MLHPETRAYGSQSSSRLLLDQRLPEMDQSLSLVEAERGVSLEADFIFKQTVAGDFRIPAGTGPGFGGLDQGASPTCPSQVRIDIPAFDVPDRRSLASVCVSPSSGFEEAAQAAVLPIDDENSFASPGPSGN